MPALTLVGSVGCSQDCWLHGAPEKAEELDTVPFFVGRKPPPLSAITPRGIMSCQFPHARFSSVLTVRGGKGTTLTMQMMERTKTV